jgi:hypothetical protein
VGEATNFWIVEGVALYMESLRCHGGYATVGGFEADRVQYSRHRALGERFYIPLQQVVTLGRQQLQQHPEIRRLYTQAAGLTHFLMDFENQKYRPALLAYLRRVYESRDAADTLRRITDVEPRQLDAQYLEFLNVTDAMLAELSPNRQLEKLCLCQTSISDNGLQRLAGQVRLTWLDVSRTAVTDKGLAVLAGARQLHQLNLAGTRVSDAALKTIGQLRSLEELDLSGTGITDEGVRQLAGLGDLRGLWLSGTHVTDAGLEHLYGLRNLEILDITNARVSTAGWQAISQALPGLAADAEGHQRGFEDRP